MNKTNQDIPGFFKISRDTTRTKIKLGFRELNLTSKATPSNLSKLYR